MLSLSLSLFLVIIAADEVYVDGNIEVDVGVDVGIDVGFGVDVDDCALRSQPL